MSATNPTPTGLVLNPVGEIVTVYRGNRKKHTGLSIGCVDKTAELENAEASGAYGTKRRAATSSQLRHALHLHAWLKSHEINKRRVPSLPFLT